MDAARFDFVAKALWTTHSRRRLIAPLASGVVAVLGSGRARPDETLAKNKHKDHGNAKKKGTLDQAKAESQLGIGARCAPPRNKHGKNHGCNQCRSGFSVAHSNRKGKTIRKCACKPVGQPATTNDSFQCCSGLSDGVACVNALGTTAAPPVATCDVCPSGCSFSSVQTAINAFDPQLNTIRVCAGTYAGNLTIPRSLTLIGAGDGDRTAGVTTLQGTGSGSVVRILVAGIAVTLQGLRITGGLSPNGGGIRNDGGTLTVVDSTVTGNTASSFGGGMYNNLGTVRLTGSTLSDNTAGVLGGGIHNDNGSTATIDSASRVILNTAPPAQGGGIWNNSTVTLATDQIVTTNFGGNCAPPASVPNCVG